MSLFGAIGKTDLNFQMEENKNMSQFERKLFELLGRAGNIKSPIISTPMGLDRDEYNRPSIIYSK